MATPATNIAEDRASDLKALVGQLADTLSGRTFSPRITLLDLAKVKAATGIAERTLERMVADGKFPKPQTGIGKRLWRESAIIAWMDRNDPNIEKAG